MENSSNLRVTPKQLWTWVTTSELMGKSKQSGHRGALSLTIIKDRLAAKWHYPPLWEGRVFVHSSRSLSIRCLAHSSKPLRKHTSFSVVDILIVMDCHFNYFLILNSHVIKGCIYRARPGMELQAPHTEGVLIQLALMSVESWTLQVANKHNLQADQVTQIWRSVRFAEGTMLFARLLQ